MNTGREPGRAPDATRDDSTDGAALAPGAPEASGAGGAAAGSSRRASAAGATGSGVTSAAGLVFDDPFDRPSSDDTDRGWGESSVGTGDDDFTRFLNEKPPHHL
jgi:hypothetical protein